MSKGLSNYHGLGSRISAAVSTGAGREIRMQVELIILLCNDGIQAVRGVPLEPPDQALRMDKPARDEQGE